MNRSKQYKHYWEFNFYNFVASCNSYSCNKSNDIRQARQTHTNDACSCMSACIKYKLKDIK